MAVIALAARNARVQLSGITLALLTLVVAAARAYPPAVGITGSAPNCLTCHANNGPWTDEAKVIIDVVDKERGNSLKQADGSFLIEAKRNETKTVMTVIGWPKKDAAPAPYRNAWLFVDPTTLKKSSLSKFAPGWEVNLPMSCRRVGDAAKGFEKANVTALPLAVRPTDAARDAELDLQVMLTKGESVKGNAKEGMLGNYFVRTVRLRVTD
ncbi:MAG: hypothetical protein HY318_05570 [Armatimonadetes bacterium]|nr:hypothetical protein [Armatimonadota bacterium]